MRRVHVHVQSLSRTGRTHAHAHAKDTYMHACVVIVVPDDAGKGSNPASKQPIAAARDDEAQVDQTRKLATPEHVYV